MDLIPTLSFFNVLAGIPLVVMLIPVIRSLIQAIMSNPIVNTVVNTTLVVLKNTEVVWRPAIKFSVMLLKPILHFAIAVIKPILKALMLIFPKVMNLTRSFFQQAQELGMSMTSALSSMTSRLGELGDALIVLSRAIAQFAFYMIRAAGFVAGAFESVFHFGKRLLFEPHLMSWQDMYNVAVPFAVVLTILGTLYWMRKKPQQPIQQTCASPTLRRSSRIARKRAMLCAGDLSDALPACKESSSTSTNL